MNVEIKTKDRFFKINDVKVFTPKDIKNLDYGGYLVFGDSDIKNCPISKDDLEMAKVNNLLIVLLKKTKSKNKPNVYAFSEKIEIVKSYRKNRLANAIHLQVIGEATNKPHQTKEEFIKSEFNTELEGLELEAAYLLSENNGLIEKDIKRLITLMYQTNANSKQVSREYKKNNIAKVG